LRKASLSEAARTLREEHERRMALLSEATRIGLDRLRALAALQVPPVTRSIRGILASVLLDRLAVGIFCFFALFVLAIYFGITHGAHHMGIAVGVVLGAWL